MGWEYEEADDDETRMLRPSRIILPLSTEQLAALAAGESVVFDDGPIVIEICRKT